MSDNSPEELGYTQGREAQARMAEEQRERVSKALARTAKCRYCESRILWARHIVSNALMPIETDPDLNAKGNCVLTISRHKNGYDVLLVEVLGKEAAEATTRTRYAAHFEHCTGYKR